jgi:hypothetical protein
MPINIFLASAIIFLSSASVSSATRVDTTMHYPEDFGVLFDVEHYKQIIKDQELIRVAERTKNFVSTCLVEHGPYERCRDEIVSEPCDDEGAITSSGNINYCTSGESNQLAIKLPMTFLFRHYDRAKDNIMPQAQKNMVYSALNCMAGIYSQYDIKLDLQSYEAKGKDTNHFDMMVIDGVTSQNEMHLITIGRRNSYNDHESMCQLITHEVSHHLGLPDRYKMKRCPLVKSFPLGSIMSSKRRDGYQGISIIEEDLFDIFAHACPGTVEAFKAYPDMVLPPNLPLQSLPEPILIAEEPEKNFFIRFKEWFDKPLFR